MRNATRSLLREFRGKDAQMEFHGVCDVVWFPLRRWLYIIDDNTSVSWDADVYGDPNRIVDDWLDEHAEPTARTDAQRRNVA